MNIRNKYCQFGVKTFYEKFGKDYLNPHESQVKKIIDKIRSDLKLDNVLDLACGGGEVTKALNIENISGIDPYTWELYQDKTGKQVEKFSFSEIYRGALDGRKYSLIICSFAMHLLKESELPWLLHGLSQISEQLLIITPHKRPEIKYYWKLIRKIKIERVNAKLYESKHLNKYVNGL